MWCSRRQNNFLGTAVIGYTITMALVAPAPRSSRIGNEPHSVAVNDSGNTPKNVAVMIPVLVNDSDPVASADHRERQSDETALPASAAPT